MWLPPKRESRDEKLWALLPALDSPYDDDRLTNEETDALIEALTDGFGKPFVNGMKPLPIPSKAKEKSGLLEHSFYDVEYDPEDDPEDVEESFWETGPDDAPAPGEVFPLEFNIRRLRVYFYNQFGRFCFKCGIVDEDRQFEKERWIGEHYAMQMLYRKPWYEYHALQFFYFILEGRISMERHPRLGLLVLPAFGGQLGRLVEQYYWRFRFEGAAITGSGARKGASAGGKAKAALYQAKHVAWQRLASQVWSERPDLSKMAVAEIIKKRLRTKHTARHIRRYILHP
jgi:hypothetical protein